MRKDVAYKDVIFEVEGENIPYRPSTYLQPSEGGYIYIRKIWYNGIDVTEVVQNPNKHLIEKEEEIFLNGIKCDELYILLEDGNHYDGINDAAQDDRDY